jgi:hypothetical protein
MPEPNTTLVLSEGEILRVSSAGTTLTLTGDPDGMVVDFHGAEQAGYNFDTDEELFVAPSTPPEELTVGDRLPVGPHFEIAVLRALDAAGFRAVMEWLRTEEPSVCARMQTAFGSMLEARGERAEPAVSGRMPEFEPQHAAVQHRIASYGGKR